MRLLALMYHRARAGPHGNSPEMLDRHFAHIAQHHRCVLPGDGLKPGAINVCLTFDDAYFDFYAIVFPLLKKHGLRALLAVPTCVVLERCDLPAESRLAAAAAEVTAEQAREGGFCTWPELRELASNGHVMIAAHGSTHCRLDQGDVDLQAEITLPQAVLTARVGRPVKAFVFPYGRFSPGALYQGRQSYRYAFRIGGADNTGWSERIIYRVNADNLTDPGQPFRASRLAVYRARRFWNRLRGR